MNKIRKQRPAVKGLTWHRDQYYSFFLPMGWHGFTWTDGRQGHIFGPDPDDPLTIFAVEIKDLVQIHERHCDNKSAAR